MTRQVDLTGKVFERLTVIKFLETRPNGKYWVCSCICGNITNVSTSKLNSKHTRSCGCLNKEVTSKRSKEDKKHGHCINGVRSPEYTAWKSMKTRCYCTGNNYKGWNGRGITVCERWLDKDNGFLNFLSDMGQRPSGDFYSLDRIDNDGNYEPSNCRWATAKQQTRNTRTNRMIYGFCDGAGI